MMTIAGGILIAAAVIVLAVGIVRNPGAILGLLGSMFVLGCFIAFAVVLVRGLT